MTLNFSKKYLVCAFAFFANTQTFTDSALPKEAVIASYQGQDDTWKYFEYLFVYQPTNKLNHITNHAGAALGLVGSATLAAKYANKLPEFKTENNNVVNNIAVVLAAFATGNTLYNFLNCYAKRKVHREALENILSNWNTHREYVPSKFVPLFDELSTMYQEAGSTILTDSLVSEVFEIVHHHLEHNFASRYKKDEVKREGTFSTIKSMTDIMKNLAK